MLDICTEFLTNRRQRVVVDGIMGDWSDVKSGVPQGSVLGPLLFILYTSGLFDGLENELVAYADDTTLMAVIKNLSSRPVVLASINRDLVRIQEWCSQWHMKLNPSKTKSMVVSRKDTDESSHGLVLVSDTRIEISNSLEILGVTFDKELKFAEHIRLCVGNVSRRIGLLRLAKNVYGDADVVRKCYNAFVLPSLEYCSGVWGSAAQFQLSKLDRLVRRADQLCPAVARHTLAHRRKVSNLCMLYKIMANNNHCLNSRLPPPLARPRNTRQATNSHDSCRQEGRDSQNNLWGPKYKRTFVPSTIKLWNSLPAVAFAGESLSSFKSEVNRYLLDNVST